MIHGKILRIRRVYRTSQVVLVHRRCCPLLHSSTACRSSSLVLPWRRCITTICTYHSFDFFRDQSNVPMESRSDQPPFQYSACHRLSTDSYQRRTIACRHSQVGSFRLISIQRALLSRSPSPFSCVVTQMCAKRILLSQSNNTTRLDFTLCIEFERFVDDLSRHAECIVESNDLDHSSSITYCLPSR
jgi:hypothetical protein